MSKLYTLIIDDTEALKIQKIIDNSVLTGHCEVEVCKCVESIPSKMKNLKPKIAIDLITQRAKEQLEIDFAFVDVQFEAEFGDDTTSIGANKVLHALQENFPKCRVIVLSKNEGEFLDRTVEYNGVHYPTIRKTAKQEYLNQIIETQVDIWTQRMVELYLSERDSDKLQAAVINNSDLPVLKIRNSNWAVEDLFPILCKDGISYKGLMKYFSFFPKVGANQWETGVTGKFDTGIKYYYEELYFNPRYQGCIKSIVNTRSEKLLDAIAEWYFRTNDENPTVNIVDNDEKKRIKTLESLIAAIAIKGTCAIRLKNQLDLSVMEMFMNRLIGRQVAICSYLLFNLNRETIYALLHLGSVGNYRCNGANMTQLITTSLYLNDVETGKRNQNFSKIFGDASADERKFLTLYFEKAKGRLNATAVDINRHEAIHLLFHSVDNTLQLLLR